jgi:hypothetical protein
MKNRTAAIIITILVVLCCGCPGLSALCWGMISAVDYAGGLGITGIGDQNGFLGSIFGGLCGGILLIGIVVLVAFLLLRKKKDTTTTIIDTPPTPPEVPPTSPDEPLPPAI